MMVTLRVCMRQVGLIRMGYPTDSDPHCRQYIVVVQNKGGERGGKNSMVSLSETFVDHLVLFQREKNSSSGILVA